MGYYINQDSKGNLLPSKGKSTILVADGGERIPPPTEWKEGLVCVVSNATFEAAAYAYDEAEMEAFLYPDGRPKQWLQLAHAKQLAK